MHAITASLLPLADDRPSLPKAAGVHHYPGGIGVGEVTAMSEEAELYTVVINDEEQYSIWPQGREIPAGWREAGKSGTKEECLAYVDEVWTDMRPRSLREGR
jgi:MbtH protein